MVCLFLRQPSDLWLVQAVQQADFVVPVEIEYHWHHFHVLKRPGVDEFLRRMGEIYEVVIFTASLSKVRRLVFESLLLLTPLYSTFSMPILYWTNSTFIVLSPIVSFAKVVLVIKAIISRFVISLIIGSFGKASEHFNRIYLNWGGPSQIP